MYSSTRALFGLIIVTMLICPVTIATLVILRGGVGLGELVKVKDRLMYSGIELALINCAPRVASLITVAGADRFFKVVRSEDELLQR